MLTLEEKKRKRLHTMQANNGAAEYPQAAEAEEKANAEWEAKFGTKLPYISESESESDVEDPDVILRREGIAQYSDAAKFANAEHKDKQQRIEKKGGNYKLKRYGKTKRRNGKTKRRYGKTKRRNGKTKRTRKIR